MRRRMECIGYLVKRLYSIQTACQNHSVLDHSVLNDWFWVRIKRVHPSCLGISQIFVSVCSYSPSNGREAKRAIGLRW